MSGNVDGSLLSDSGHDDYFNDRGGTMNISPVNQAIIAELQSLLDNNSIPSGESTPLRRFLEDRIKTCRLENDTDVGMYQVDNPGYPKVVVGHMVILKHNDDSVWIEDRSPDGGEGGQFQNELVEKALAEFFHREY